MPLPVDDAAAPDLDRHPPLGRIFVLILLVEVLTWSALYWFGRHFV